MQQTESHNGGVAMGGGSGRGRQIVGGVLHMQSHVLAATLGAGLSGRAVSLVAGVSWKKVPHWPARGSGRGPAQRAWSWAWLRNTGPRVAVSGRRSPAGPWSCACTVGANRTTNQRAAQGQRTGSKRGVS